MVPSELAKRRSQSLLESPYLPGSHHNQGEVHRLENRGRTPNLSSALSPFEILTVQPWNMTGFPLHCWVGMEVVWWGGFIFAGSSGVYSGVSVRHCITILLTRTQPQDKQGCPLPTNLHPLPNAPEFPLFPGPQRSTPYYSIYLLLYRFRAPCAISFFFFQFYFIFKLYIIVLVLPNIKMNPPQVYMCCTLCNFNNKLGRDWGLTITNTLTKHPATLHPCCHSFPPQISLQSSLHTPSLLDLEFCRKRTGYYSFYVL